MFLKEYVITTIDGFDIKAVQWGVGRVAQGCSHIPSSKGLDVSLKSASSLFCMEGEFIQLPLQELAKYKDFFLTPRFWVKNEG